ncbi:hypothetical protein KAF25_008878 [Fusarium avenaceum]|uniref:Uncharacterized protein n=1 Tax=Fusarium avenaceum TaxID=40199 RepID=A0A9P7GTH9_9HYPO|nr:hypothetical protein KAF25_008878 [Fusarium avenaceum]
MNGSPSAQWVRSGQAIQPALAQFQAAQARYVSLESGPLCCNYRSWVAVNGLLGRSTDLISRPPSGNVNAPSTSQSTNPNNLSLLAWLLFSSCTSSCQLLNAATSITTRIKSSLLQSLFAVAFAPTRIVHRPSSYAPQVSSPEKTTIQTHTEDSALTTHGLDGDCFLIIHLYFGILSLY